MRGWQWAVPAPRENMDAYKLIGTLGAFIVAAGVFMPSRLHTVAAYVSYYTDYRTNALMLIGLAAVALLLVYMGSPIKLLTFGVLTLTMVGWTQMRRIPGLYQVEHQVSQFAAQATSLPGLQQATASITNYTPWWVMLAGSTLLVISGLLYVRKV